MNERMRLTIAGPDRTPTASPYSRELIAGRVHDHLAITEALLEPDRIESLSRLVDEVTASLRDGGKLILFGNGGSAADASHLAAEFVGRFAVERDALPALSLSDNCAAVTAIGNDYGYDSSFSRQVRAFGAPGDIAIALSTSGSSANVLRAIDAARDASMIVAAFTGADGYEMAALADIGFVIPTSVTARVQECYMLYGHILCEAVESEMFGQGALDETMPPWR
jgi:D-sedoheptulose 7-phosphate isomerase